MNVKELKAILSKVPESSDELEVVFVDTRSGVLEFMHTSGSIRTISKSDDGSAPEKLGLGGKYLAFHEGE